MPPYNDITHSFPDIKITIDKYNKIYYNDRISIVFFNEKLDLIGIFKDLYTNNIESLISDSSSLLKKI